MPIHKERKMGTFQAGNGMEISMSYKPLCNRFFKLALMQTARQTNHRQTTVATLMLIDLYGFKSHLKCNGAIDYLIIKLC